MSGREPRPDPHFQSWQRSYFDYLVAELKPGSRHRLFVPVGCGRTYTVTYIIAEFLRVGRLQRVLVLTRRSLIDQWDHILSKVGARASKLDGAKLRLVRNSLVHAGEPPEEGIQITSIDLARREDMAAILMLIPWDLIVLDNVSIRGNRSRSMIEVIQGRQSRPALLSIHPTTFDFESEDESDKNNDPALSSWNDYVVNQVPSFIPDSLRARPRFHQYSLTPEEERLGEKILDLARKRGHQFLRACASSMANLEKAVEGLASDDPENYEQAIEAIEALETDSRLAAFKQLVAGLIESGFKRILVFCEYRATAHYLAAAVDDLAPEVFQLDSQTARAERYDIPPRFAENGGVLIVTPAVFSGMEFRCDAAIHYDFPWKPKTFYVRMTCLRRTGPDESPVNYIMASESDPLNSGETIRKVLDKLDSLRSKG